uniref:Uncharacterized protein n=1 Tax=Triticum urartu TaxID=4572 RepID=A0A8R7R282_TRIUA
KKSFSGSLLPPPPRTTSKREKTTDAPSAPPPHPVLLPCNLQFSPITNPTNVTNPSASPPPPVQSVVFPSSHLKYPALLFPSPFLHDL